MEFIVTGVFEYSNVHFKIFYHQYFCAEIELKLTSFTLSTFESQFQTIL